MSQEEMLKLMGYDEDEAEDGDDDETDDDDGDEEW